jgi:hypothetical protein
VYPHATEKGIGQHRQNYLYESRRVTLYLREIFVCFSLEFAGITSQRAQYSDADYRKCYGVLTLGKPPGIRGSPAFLSLKKVASFSLRTYKKRMSYRRNL